MVTALARVEGRICDIDTHEVIPAALWDECFGDSISDVAAMFAALPPENPMGMRDRDSVADLRRDLELPPDLWALKGSTAPGSVDMGRRPAVMDRLGVARTLIFPSGPGALGLIFVSTPAEMVHANLGIPVGFDVVEAGRRLCRAHNDWCISVAHISDRLRPVATVDTSSISGAMAEVERLRAGGVRAIMIPTSVTFERTLSPAHPAVDPFWDLLEDNDIPLLLHVGSDFGFVDPSWQNAPQFESSVAANVEFGLNPYSLSVVHLANVNFLTTMILGGVFERHPRLRVGAIETTAHWLGPFVQNLTMWARQFSSRLAKELSLSPAEYVQRNLRVSAFWWEPVDQYIDNHGLEGVYCYASDYPHFESGFGDSRQGFAERLERFGPDLVERFFVTNAELLVPA